MYIQQLGEIIPPPRYNNVGVCNQISFLVLYYNSSRLVTLLEVINAPIKVPDIVDLTDAAKLGCINWTIVALNREGWRKLLKEAEAQPGL